MKGEGFAFFRWHPYRKIEYGIAYNGRGWDRYRITAQTQWRELQEQNGLLLLTTDIPYRTSLTVKARHD